MSQHFRGEASLRKLSERHVSAEKQSGFRHLLHVSGLSRYAQLGRNKLECTLRDHTGLLLGSTCVAGLVCHLLEHQKQPIDLLGRCQFIVSFVEKIVGLLGKWTCRGNCSHLLKEARLSKLASSGYMRKVAVTNPLEQCWPQTSCTDA